jgi:hypothetical protein
MFLIFHALLYPFTRLQKQLFFYNTAADPIYYVNQLNSIYHSQHGIIRCRSLFFPVKPFGTDTVSRAIHALSVCTASCRFSGMIFYIVQLKETTMKPLHYLIPAALMIGTVIACNKNNDTTTDLKIRLTDNPYNATEVNVDIQQVRVNFRDDSTGWVNLDTRAGVYNLLNFQNGIDTLIAQTTVPTGTLKEVRFVLGSQNSIKIDNNVYPLSIPSGSESGLKIKLNKQLNAHFDSLVIDFDAALSILQTGAGDYKLKPVLKIK